ncbi:MAG: type II toxin-antitoxin system RelE/ParE family toxin [Smithella sp.]|jgi:addiction module RelE/StbE family toxin
MSSEKFTVLIYPTAEKDLFEIKEYFETTLKTSAIPLFEKFYASIDILETNPYIHPLLKDAYLQQLGYRMIPIDNFLIFYIVKDGVVQIHRFLYGKRDYSHIL